MTFKLHFSWVLTALFFITLQAVAQQQMLLGYCPDELTAEAEPVMLDANNNTLFKAAIVLPEARMKLLKGAKSSAGFAANKSFFSVYFSNMRENYRKFAECAL